MLGSPISGLCSGSLERGPDSGRAVRKHCLADRSEDSGSGLSGGEGPSLKRPQSRSTKKLVAKVANMFYVCSWTAFLKETAAWPVPSKPFRLPSLATDALGAWQGPAG